MNILIYDSQKQPLTSMLNVEADLSKIGTATPVRWNGNYYQFWKRDNDGDFCFIPTDLIDLDEFGRVIANERVDIDKKPRTKLTADEKSIITRMVDDLDCNAVSRMFEAIWEYDARNRVPVLDTTPTALRKSAKKMLKELILDPVSISVSTGMLTAIRLEKDRYTIVFSPQYASYPE